MIDDTQSLDIAALLEDRGFVSVDFILGPALD